MLDVCRNTNGTAVHVEHVATEWTWQYNHERSNMGLAATAPKQGLMAATETLLSPRVKAKDYRSLDTPEILFRPIAPPMIG